MNDFPCRRSWDTTVKHLARHRVLDDVLSPEQITTIPRSNISRWKHESDNKYSFCEINKIVKEEVEFIKRFNQSSRIKCINKSYFKLCDTFHEVISKVKGVKSVIKKQKELVVNTIESIKDTISVDTALKVFNISRSTFEHYKSLVIHTCEASYFKWCTRRFPNQLLPKEVEMITNYMNHQTYKYWSKASIYLKAVRDKEIHFSMTTFYKYCQLLGFGKQTFKQKKDFYKPLRTSKPNELWCADVTIFKTIDHTKHYLHFLMDHYSKKILGYRIESSSSAQAITSLLKEATTKYEPDKICFLTDGGSENVNSSVSNFLTSQPFQTKHMIAQKDVVFSNSMIEALNKVIKQQFLYPLQILTRTSLEKILAEVVSVYNYERPQIHLQGNTPFETYNGTPIDFGRYTMDFFKQKQLRILENQKSKCKVCTK